MLLNRLRTALVFLLVLALVPVQPAWAIAPGAMRPEANAVIMFAADGMRQDLVEQFVAEGTLRSFRNLLMRGTVGADHGLITQAPTNTGAGWYTLATGAWPGVHGSTNNTFHRNGAAFTTSTSSFTAGILQAETIAQAAERGGKKVAQIEWAGGRVGVTDGPTVDFRSFFSGRGVATNYIGASDDAAFTQSFGLQFDHPSGFAGNAPFAGAAPVPATGWTNVPRSFSPPMEMRLRVLDFGVDKYGLNVYLYDSTNDRRTNYDRVLFSPTKNGADAVATLRAGQWADVKVKIVGGASAGLTAGMLLKVETLSSTLSQVRLFHTSVSRANASWPTWPGERGFTGDFAEYLAQTFPTSTAGDFAVLEAGIVSEETYVEQAFAWETAHHPMIRYILRKYRPDLVLVGYPGTDELSHQFLGLITPTLPNGIPNPAFDDVKVDGTRDGRVEARTEFIRRAYEGADATYELVRSLMPTRTASFIASDHGFAPQFLAIDASKVLVDLGLLSRSQTGNCAPATGETIGKAKACWAGGTVQIYLNQAGRDPAGGGLQQVSATDAPAVLAQIKAAFLALADPNDWTHDGQPEGWQLIDQVLTKAEARHIPNGPDSTADMAHPTRTGDLVIFALPPYQFDAATPGTLVARSAFFGQHGYRPTLQDLAGNTNMRATFIAGGEAIGHGTVGARSIDIAPTVAYLLRIPVPQQTQGRVLLEMLKEGEHVTPITIIGLNDFHGQLDPTTMAFDNAINANVGGAGPLGAMFDEERASYPGPALLLAGGDNVGASPPSSALLEDMPTIDVENAWGLDATSYGNHEFDFGPERLVRQQLRANFPFLAVNIIETRTGIEPFWVERSRVFTVNGVKVGVIGAGLETTPELVSAGNTDGLTFLPAAQRIREESEALRRQGVTVQVVVIHEGTAVGQNAIANVADVPWQGPIVTIAEALKDTTVDVIVAGHTHRVSNVMVGDILVVEGINAGATYSVVQLMVRGGDVQWAGGATRIAKDLGVTPKPAVQAIVDQANTQTAPLRNAVIGTQVRDIKRDLTRLHESAMGNFVADVMRARYLSRGAEAALTNSGGLRADLVCAPPSSANEPDCAITFGEAFAVLPFGNQTVIETLTGAQLTTAFLNGFSPFCNPAINTGRFPQISGLKVQFHCTGTTPVVDGIWKAPNGPAGPLTPIGPADTVRLVTNDFMFTGGDGYTVFAGGTNVAFTGELLLDIVIDEIEARSTPPDSGIDAAVEGRIVGP